MVDYQLDCWCDTCQRKITLVELQSGTHAQHHFNVIEIAALQAMVSYLKVAAVLK